MQSALLMSPELLQLLEMKTVIMVEKQCFGMCRCTFLRVTRRDQRGKCELVTVKLPPRHSFLPPLFSLFEQQQLRSFAFTRKSTASAAASSAHCGQRLWSSTAELFHCFTWVIFKVPLKSTHGRLISSHCTASDRRVWPVWCFLVPRKRQRMHMRVLLQQVLAKWALFYECTYCQSGSGSEAVVLVKLDIKWFTI